MSNLEQIIGDIVENIKELVQNNNIMLSILIGSFIVILESIIPALPLAVFIAINIIAFGNFWGFIISWISTIIGCSISFWIFRSLKEKIFKRVKKDSRILKIMRKIGNMNFSHLVVITAMPFTPAFSINIASGLSEINYKRFLFMIIIAKLSIIYFWGFVGTTLLESITDVTVIIKILFLIFITFILSKIVMKHFDI